ncbi:SDR family NAD(P)-dependent oxidoreductase [Streptomyces sp. NBC_01515]|uniref:SDR family NAD(P)-dependent oxidoreductase n=1 Tax=Streptomyces sp. NBC_01515 TaxID=2903890 RepID=UPI003865EAC9
MDLSNRTVLIVGGTSGIGRELAHRFAAAGSTVAVGGRGEKALAQLAGDGFGTFTVDVTDDASVTRARDAVLARHPELDTVVTMSGVMLLEDLRDPAHLVFWPMEEHFGDAALDAVRRQFLEMVGTRDPAVGLHSEPFARQLRELVMGTPVLMERAFLAAQKGTRDLAAHLAEETGDLMQATIAAPDRRARQPPLPGGYFAKM